MVKVKKFLSLLITIFLILSTFAFAEYSSDPSYYEGKPIDESKEGKEYYREGNVIVYPAKMGSKEERMMERFARGELSEQEMRAMAKAKSGSSFDEMEFKKEMMDLKDRVQRKDAFSYENEGYGQTYSAGPSYEGYSKEQIIFGMVFQHIGDDVDPRDIKQYCSDPNKVADIVIKKLKDKVGDLQKLCTRFEEQESKCNEYSEKGCSQIGTSIVRNDATEAEKLQSVAYSCPANKDAIVEACKKRSLSYMEQRIKNTEETCKQRFDFEGERLTKECERFRENTICDKEKFIGKCMGGIKKEDFERKKCPENPVSQCDAGTSVQKKTDANGCVYYYCEKITTNVCAQDVQQCPDGSYVKRIPPGCNFESCPTTTKCPSTPPAGCPIYECVPGAVSVQNPTTCCYECKSSNSVAQHCKETDGGYDIYTKGVIYPFGVEPGKSDVCINDKTLAEYGCNPDGSYGGDKQYTCEYGCKDGACLRSSVTTCPDSSIPTCAAGTTIQKKTDDKGCVYYYCQTTTATPSTTSNSTPITGSVVLSTYDDYLSHCENSWLAQQRACSNTPNVCDKDTFIEKCKEQEKRNYGDFTLKIAKNCELQTQSEIKHMEQRCAGIDEERSRCLEQSTKRCEQMKGVAEKCKETLTEENLRKFIVEETKKRCKFTDIIEDEDDVKKSEKAEIVLAVLNTATEDDIEKLELFIDDLKEDLKLQDTTVYKGTINPNNFGDIKLLPFVVNAKLSSAASSERAKEVKARIVAGQNAEESAGKLASLRDSDVPNEYLYIIEDKASDVLNVSNNLKEIEKKEDEKGFGYKVRRFLGLAKKAEEAEIKQLGESKEKLKGSIDVLAKLADEVPSDVAKSILKEQVESLKKQQEDIEVLIKTKEKKAKGLLGIFG